ncbi:MmgE/PrpD family protein [Verticiella sediminum]|uniref:MmgE/PrpD family protein n=1 Tax=Verticiella sediminum TaxID=1247510 RepID=A0A556ATM9_9BURK|nr:MmgE/PrpD family protein [Verticiella sediminum]TSH96301.1 MmgE/PrpD family protein [Verticiella sediminum]
MKAALTRDLAAATSGLTYERIPRAGIEIAKRGFIDAIGVMLAGKDEPCVSILAQTLSPAAGDASLFWGPDKARAPEAAWINAVATHALDFDDTALSAHPSAVLVPAIVAEAEHLRASGRDMLCAYVAGFEAWADLMQRETGQYHTKGWHPTGIFGSIAAAAACARLRRLDAGATAAALSLGASQSAGITANFGSMAKPLHAGRAAHAGVLAARLAAAGMTASTDALEHPQGFLAAVSPAGAVNVGEPVTVGQRWRIVEIGLNIKKYPTCYCTHRPIDAMLELKQAHPSLDPAQVAGIVVSMSRRNAKVLRNAHPTTGLEAKFSIEFAMACALTAGRVGLDELDDRFVRRPDIQGLFERVRLVFDPREDPATGYAPHDQVSVELPDGRTLRSSPVALARGAAGAPLSHEEIRTKFMSCAARALPEAAAASLHERLSNLEDLRLLCSPPCSP